MKNEVGLKDGGREASMFFFIRLYMLKSAILILIRFS